MDSNKDNINTEPILNIDINIENNQNNDNLENNNNITDTETNNQSTIVSSSNESDTTISPIKVNLIPFALISSNLTSTPKLIRFINAFTSKFSLFQFSVEKA